MDFFRKNSKDRDKNGDKAKGKDEKKTKGDKHQKDRGENEEPEDAKKTSMTDKVSTYLKPYIKSASTWTVAEVNDAKHDMQKTLGLGGKPDAIADGEAFINAEPRTVEIGWHPVAGATGKWFAEKTMIGTAITERVKGYPDPTQHWAVLVGGYVHQLWMDGGLDIIYINEELKRDEWHTFVVGKTKFNDQALLKAGRMTIHNMRHQRPAYNLISNNCQNFATEMLKAIQVGALREFGTTFAIYKRATGEGAIKDLYTDRPEEEQPQELQDDQAAVSGLERHDTVMVAQQVMDENTTQLDHDRD